MFAITAASMLAVIGLLYSFGLVLTQRRALQTAADAASLSGAWQVLREQASDNRSDAVVLASVVQFATTNGVPSDGTLANATNLTAVYLDGAGAQLATVGSASTFPTAARGVRVTVHNQVSTVLPNFLQVWQLLVRDTAAASVRPTASPAMAALVVPLAVRATDVATALAAHTTYDLFSHPLSGGQAPTLNLAGSGAPTWGTIGVNVQNWSDGQHSGAWQLSQPSTVALAGGDYYDSIVAGLRDNIRRQGLVDSSGASYVLVTLPVYDTSTATNVHVVGFAQMKLRNVDITSSPTAARGTFVVYPAAAWGTAIAPTVDVGAAFVALVQ